MNKPLVVSQNLIVLHVLFFLSGVSALIYQLMWQRMLFNVYGVDLESITIVVSVFMLGLGVGGIIGGYLADKFVAKLLFIYVLAELGIAFFGFFSSSIIAEVATLPSVEASRWLSFLSCYAILFFPTLLMGATFPVLVKHVSSIRKNIGYSVGELYFSNTIGGALGAILPGYIFLPVFDIEEVIYNAVFINFTIAITAVIAFGRDK
ncbi:spermidine synthase [Legionella massiliensis]|uniref:Spermidine synthase n=1 Tax=Legionella massiliensis TaxID=1034943 RepID=A0A078KWK2_9GAMM|nr:fused MFS/spermidine synthase [Legionella massiliensis]CDZ78845.1 spermidine synthase [Legionella massiliensis]CEE14583.1 spermidine synthase [Legionella massiliensis]